MPVRILITGIVIICMLRMWFREMTVDSIFIIACPAIMDREATGTDPGRGL